MKVDDYALGFDAVAFAREALGITPDVRQAEILAAPVKRGILNCSRQWGKSTITAAMARLSFSLELGSIRGVWCWC